MLRKYAPFLPNYLALNDHGFAIEQNLEDQVHVTLDEIAISYPTEKKALIAAMPAQLLKLYKAETSECALFALMFFRPFTL